MSKRSKSLLFSLFLAAATFCQTDYTNLNYWAFHPNQNINLLALYNLDIAVIDENLDTDSIIEIENQAKTNS